MTMKILKQISKYMMSILLLSLIFFIFTFTITSEYRLFEAIFKYSNTISLDLENSVNDSPSSTEQEGLYRTLYSDETLISFDNLNLNQNIMSNASYDELFSFPYHATFDSFFSSLGGPIVEYDGYVQSSNGESLKLKEPLKVGDVWITSYYVSLLEKYGYYEVVDGNIVEESHIEITRDNIGGLILSVGGQSFRVVGIINVQYDVNDVIESEETFEYYVKTHKDMFTLYHYDLSEIDGDWKVASYIFPSVITEHVSRYLLDNTINGNDHLKSIDLPFYEYPFIEILASNAWTKDYPDIFNSIVLILLVISLFIFGYKIKLSLKESLVLGLSAFVSVFIILTLIDYHMTLKYYDLFGSIYKPEWLDMIFYLIVIALFSIFNYIGSQYKITLLNIEKK
jgi:hypothetical protein